MKKIFINKIKRPYVFVPMCLDYMHHGHVNILNNAKKKLKLTQTNLSKKNKKLRENREILKTLKL